MSDKTEVIGVRFKEVGKVYYFDPDGVQYSIGDKVIVETSRGKECGEVAADNRFVDNFRVVPPLKKVIRMANAADLERLKQNRAYEEQAIKKCEEKVAARGLDMKLVGAEYAFDGSKIIFYFTADGRVDFRELVKDLAAAFRTRIELRQIGVRDEAKMLGGLGICGRPFCCKTFLSDFAQVSIKMAKEQNLSLSSSKISGTCGRLMCCLRFEHDTYEREYATFPKVDSIIETANGRGVIVESNFLTGKIKAKMDGDAANVFRTYTKKEVRVVGRVKGNKADERTDVVPGND